MQMPVEIRGLKSFAFYVIKGNMKKILPLFLLLCCTTLLGQKTTRDEIKQLKSDLAQVSFDISRKPDLQKPDLDAYHDRVEKIIEEAELLKGEINANVDEHQDLLDRLASIDTEEPSSAKDHKQTAGNDLELYQVRLAQVKSIENSANRVLIVINKKLADLEARRLFMRETPLYTQKSWKIFFHEAAVVWTALKSTLNSYATQAIKAFEKPLGYLVIALLAALQVLFYWPVRNFLKTRRHQSKLVHIILRLSRKAILPILTCLSIGISCVFLGFKDQVMLNVLLLYIGIGIAASGAVRTILAPYRTNWRIPPYGDVTALSLYRTLCWFIGFVVFLSWIDTLAQYDHLPLYFAQVVRLALRLMLCVTGLFLLQQKYWGKLKLLLIFRIFGWLIFVGSPVLVVIGYAALADYFLLGMIYTVLSGVILAGLYYATSRSIGSLFAEEKSRFSKKFALSKKGEEILQYWGRFLTILLLFCVGIVTLLFIWGLNKELITDYGKLILFGISIGRYQFSLVNLFLSIAIFCILFTASRYLQKFLEKKVFPFTNFDKGLQHALKLASGYIGVFIAIVVSLNILGLQFSSLLYILGGLSVGIGLGFQPIVTNFVSGIIMLIERPIRIGDVVDLPEGMGLVTRISVRVTEVRTYDRCSVLIPNTQLINNTVKNWTHGNRAKRVVIPIGVAYGTDPEMVKELLLTIAQNAPKSSKTLLPFVNFDAFGDSALEFKVFAYVDDLMDFVALKNHLLIEIARAFKEKEIEIPYPKQDVYFHHVGEDDTQKE